jgi:glutamate-1-semialdehyde 2,1-aminomutase
MTHRFGTLLIIDETQTICDGPGGVTRAWNLEPDIFTMGKAIAGGFPVAIMGVSQKVADSLPLLTERGRFVLGIGTTLTGNALAIAALRANLEHVMTESAYERMFSVTERLANGIDKIIKATDLPWHVNHFGNKVYYYFQPTLAEKAPASDEDLNNFIHLFLINRGILLGPLTCWAIVSAETTIEDADSHNQVFSECVNELVE